MHGYFAANTRSRLQAARELNAVDNLESVLAHVIAEIHTQPHRWDRALRDDETAYFRNLDNRVNMCLYMPPATLRLLDDMRGSIRRTVAVDGIVAMLLPPPAQPEHQPSATSINSIHAINNADTARRATG